MTDFLFKKKIWLRNSWMEERDAQGRCGEKVWSVLLPLLAYYPSQISMCSPASHFLGFKKTLLQREISFKEGELTHTKDTLAASWDFLLGSKRTREGEPTVFHATSCDSENHLLYHWGHIAHLYSGEESTRQCRRHGFNPWSRKTPHATEQLSLCTIITEV